MSVGLSPFHQGKPNKCICAAATAAGRRRRKIHIGFFAYRVVVLVAEMYGQTCKALSFSGCCAHNSLFDIKTHQQCNRQKQQHPQSLAADRTCIKHVSRVGGIMYGL